MEFESPDSVVGWYESYRMTCVQSSDVGKLIPIVSVRTSKSFSSGVIFGIFNGRINSIHSIVDSLHSVFQKISENCQDTTNQVSDRLATVFNNWSNVFNRIVDNTNTIFNCVVNSFPINSINTNGINGLVNFVSCIGSSVREIKLRYFFICGFCAFMNP